MDDSRDLYFRTWSFTDYPITRGQTSTNAYPKLWAHARTRPYSIPSCLWICSSDAPFVSGTMVMTQRSWSTIMPAKNEKT